MDGGFLALYLTQDLDNEGKAFFCLGLIVITLTILYFGRKK